MMRRCNLARGMACLAGIVLSCALGMLGVSGSAPAYASPDVEFMISRQVESTITVDHTDYEIGRYPHLSSIVRDSAGRLYVTWSDRDDSLIGVGFQSSDTGSVWSAPVSLDSSTYSAQQPGLVIDSEGGVHAMMPEHQPDFTYMHHRYRDPVTGVWSAISNLGTANFSDEVVAACNPGLDSSDRLHLVYNRTHLKGIGYRLWSGGSWGSGLAAVSWTPDSYYSNTLVLGDDLITFAQDFTSGRLLLIRRVNGTWSTPEIVTTFGFSYHHDEVVDPQGNIKVFLQDTATDSTVRYATYAPSTNTWSSWAILDAELGVDVIHPSATVDGDGNIWVVYGVGAQVCARVLDADTGTWSDREVLSAERSTYPKVRYQNNGHLAPGYIDVTYRYRQDDGQYALRYLGLVLKGADGVPVATEDSYVGQVDATLTVVSPGVLENDFGSGVPLTATLESDVSNGTLDLSEDGSFVYKGDDGWTGTDAFTYRAFNGTEFSDETTVTIEVRPHARPVAEPDYFEWSTTGAQTFAAPGVLLNDTDENGDILQARLSESPTIGSLEFHADGSFTYTPEVGFRGPVEFGYVAYDAWLESESATVTLMIDQAPDADPDSYSVPRYGELSIADDEGVLSNDSDPDGDPIEAILQTEPSHGTLDLTADGSFVYRPDEGYTGSDSFTYVAWDGFCDSEAATVSLTVTPGAAIDGTVRDEVTGLPLAGIVVRASSFGEDDPATGPAVVTITGADGTYRLAGLVDEEYSFVSFIDPADIYRDEHLWSQAVPIEFSYAAYFADLTTEVDANLSPMYKALRRVTRMSGDTRYDTAIRASQRFSNVDTVVLTSGLSYPDALAAAPLAGSYGSPILLTAPDGLPTGVLTEIRRLKASQVVIVGGEAVVTPTVATQLKNAGLSVDRISGNDRYATAEAVTRRLLYRHGDDLPTEPFVVRGDQFADALAVAPFAWNQVRPIILVEPQSAPGASVSAFRALGSDTIIVAGGTGAVGDGALFDLWSQVLEPKGDDLYLYRLAGHDRYETAAEVAGAWGVPFDRYAIASGRSFPDALAGGPLMGAYGGALLLAEPTSLPTPSAAALSADGKYLWEAIVLGGRSALADSVQQSLEAKIGTHVFDMDYLSGVSGAGATAVSSVGVAPVPEMTPKPDSRGSLSERIAGVSKETFSY